MKNPNEKMNLKTRLKEVKSELLEILDDWHYLHHILKPRLDFTYDAIFGDLEFELNCRMTYAVDLDRRIEVLSNRINKGEKVTSNTLNTVNLIVDREKKNQSELKNNWYFEQNNSISNEELSQLYRQLVKRIHPDAAGENNEFLQFWESVQSSYKSGNVGRIKLFHQTICKEVVLDNFNEIEEERALSNEIRNIEFNIVNEKKRIAKLKNEEPFCFQDRFKDQAWIISRKKQIQDRILYTDMKIQRNKRYLSRYEQNEPLVSYFQPSKNSNSYAS